MILEINHFNAHMVKNMLNNNNYDFDNNTIIKIWIE